MSALTSFAFCSDLSVRIQSFEGIPWFVAKDIALCLEYTPSVLSNVSALFKNVPDKWKQVKPFETNGGIQNLLAVTEQGLYRFLMRSDKPKAIPFQDWLSDKVLPAIRNQGAYMSEKLTYDQALKIVEERNAIEIAGRINSEQQYELKRAVSRKAYALFGNRHYSNVWNKVKEQFKVPRYTHIPATRFQEAMQYIQSLTRADFPYIKDEEPDEAEYIHQNTNKVIPLPENIRFVPVCDTFTISLRPYQEEPKALPAPTRGRPKRDPRYLTDSDIESLKNFVYYFDELFKPIIKWASKEAFAQHHPKATQFHDAWVEPGIIAWNLKYILKRIEQA